MKNEISLFEAEQECKLAHRQLGMRRNDGRATKADYARAERAARNLEKACKLKGTEMNISTWRVWPETAKLSESSVEAGRMSTSYRVDVFGVVHMDLPRCARPTASEIEVGRRLAAAVTPRVPLSAG